MLLVAVQWMVEARYTYVISTIELSFHFVPGKSVSPTKNRPADWVVDSQI